MTKGIDPTPKGTEVQRRSTRLRVERKEIRHTQLNKGNNQGNTHGPIKSTSTTKVNKEVRRGAHDVWCRQTLVGRTGNRGKLKFIKSKTYYFKTWDIKTGL